MASSPGGAPLHVFLVAGEPSGDNLGARIMQALRARTGGEVRFSGVGGPEMERNGLASLFAMDEISIFGMLEVLPHLRRVFRRMDDAAAAVAADPPDVVLTIDSPAFSFAVAERVRKRVPAVPLVHLNAPKVWAYRPRRARRVARAYDHLLVLLPFEPPYFEREGLDCTFIGHPAVESGAAAGDGPGFRRRHGLGRDEQVLCVLPGSRRGEIRRLAGDFGADLETELGAHPDLRLVLPTVPAVAGDVARAVAGWGLPITVIEDASEKFDAFAASTLALAASGTVTVELALAGVPSVVAYRLSPLTAAIVRRLVKVDTVTITNLVLEDKVVPEFLQERCTPQNLSDAVLSLLSDAVARRRQTAACAEAAARLGLGGPPPSGRAAEVILRLARDAP